MNDGGDLAVHFSHCDQGIYSGFCKYGEDETCPALNVVHRLRQAANGMISLKTDKGDYGLLEDAADEIERLRARLYSLENNG